MPSDPEVRPPDRQPGDERLGRRFVIRTARRSACAPPRPEGYDAAAPQCPPCASPALSRSSATRASGRAAPATSAAWAATAGSSSRSPPTRASPAGPRPTTGTRRRRSPRRSASSARSSSASDPRQIEKMNQLVWAETRSGLPDRQRALGALDIACWDIKAKWLGVPSTNCSGGLYRDRIPLYWSHFAGYQLDVARCPRRPAGRDAPGLARARRTRSRRPATGRSSSTR